MVGFHRVYNFFLVLKMICLDRHLGQADRVARKKMQALDESAFNSKIVFWKPWTSRFIYEKLRFRKVLHFD